MTDDSRVWTHNMKNIRIHRSFTPAKCDSAESHDAATLGAGIQDGEIIQYLAKKNMTTVIGSNLVSKEQSILKSILTRLTIY